MQLAGDDKDWARRALLVSTIAGLTVVAFHAIGRLVNVLLLFFAGIVLAAFLRAIAGWLARHLRVPMAVALTLTVIALLALGVGIGFLLVPRLTRQVPEVTSHLVDLQQQAARFVSEHGWAQTIANRLRNMDRTQALATRAFGVFSSTVGALGSCAVVIFVGLYLAGSPGTYVRGAVALVPVRKRERARDLAGEAGTTLQRWVLGRLLSCLVVGVGTAIGVWAVGTPLALSLGFIAGVLSFVPNIGPIIAVLPAIAVSLAGGLTQVALVCGVYAAVQALESFVLTPKIQERTVQVPPVLLLLAQAIMGVLTGILGVLLATPLLAILMLVVRRTYVEGLLEGGEDG